MTIKAMVCFVSPDGRLSEEKQLVGGFCYWSRLEGGFGEATVASTILALGAKALCDEVKERVRWDGGSKHQDETEVIMNKVEKKYGPA